MHKQIFLIEIIQRIGQFIVSYRPILPTLIFFPFLDVLTLDQIITPGFTYQDSIAPEGSNELFVFNQYCSILKAQLILVSVTAPAVDGEGPPIVMAVVELIIVFFCLPFFEFGILLDAKSPHHLPLGDFHINDNYTYKYYQQVFMNTISIKRFGITLVQMLNRYLS